MIAGEGGNDTRYYGKLLTLDSDVYDLDLHTAGHFGSQTYWENERHRIKACMDAADA
jgi:uncharacterized protein YfaP (DUF2135 family)